MIGPPEAQRVEVGDRARAHREHVAQDPADACRGPLIGFDVRRVVVALHLEDRRLAIADVDDAGILARAADHLRAGGGELFQMDTRGFVRTMLGPHHREDAQLGQIGLATERMEHAIIFFGGQPVLGDDLGGDVGHGLSL
jgi:hypothetical protein